MKIKHGKIKDLIVIEPDIHPDPRGWFTESWHQERYQAHKISFSFVQDNLVYSKKGSLRGLHAQHKHPQGKLITAITGEIFDVAVDLRKSSPTFGKWESVILSGKNKTQFFIPPGFAHGYCVLSDEAIISYKCTDFYLPQDEFGILWNDPDLDIKWPLKEVILSEKDKQWPLFRDIAKEYFYNF